MNLIDAEKEKLIELLKGQHFEYEFPVINKSVDSYFEEYEFAKERGIYEMSFHSIPELLRMLHEKKCVINSKKVNIQCAVSAFQNRKKYKKEEIEENNNIPEYIYNF